MMDPSTRPPRKVAIADHIWQAFEDMASQMGSDRDALINQAMFMFARLNGFLEGAGGGASQPASRPAAVAAAPSRPAPGQGNRPAPAAPPQLKPVGQGAPPRPPEPPVGAMDDDPVRREVAERVLETAAELERLIKGKNQPGANGAGDQPQDEGGMGDVDVDEGGADASGAPALYMMLEGGELDRINKERFVIGRGKHCDFVINSGKVSREHAVIVRDAGEFFIEDLGSSNGTWFNKQRIKRRKIEDGDEYFICSEKVKFVYR
ncbi:MAG: FHA domain-containing protein [Deltaproteobacteria bacterium]|nr:FHA domain-containing protein [Deltaproteobacteria bacterium]